MDARPCCSRCWRPPIARGLCSTCYHEHRRKGLLANHSLVRARTSAALALVGQPPEVALAGDPCRDCGTTGGYRRPGSRSPDRWQGRCKRCQGRFRRQETDRDRVHA